MTNEQLFDDLKQFIAATVTQQTADLGLRLDGVESKVGALEEKIDVIENNMATKQDIARLDHKIDQVQMDVGDALSQILDALDMTKQIQDHDKRLRRLEHKLA